MPRHSRRVNPDPQDFRARGSGLQQSLIDRIREGNLPRTIQDLIGPVSEKDVNTVIAVLRDLKGSDVEAWEQLSPKERRAFAEEYLRRTGGLPSKQSGGVSASALILGGLAAVGGVLYYTVSQRGVPPASERSEAGQGSGKGEEDSSQQ